MFVSASNAGVVSMIDEVSIQLTWHTRLQRTDIPWSKRWKSGAQRPTATSPSTRTSEWPHAEGVSGFGNHGVTVLKHGLLKMFEDNKV